MSGEELMGSERDTEAAKITGNSKKTVANAMRCKSEPLFETGMYIFLVSLKDLWRRQFLLGVCVIE